MSRIQELANKISVSAKALDRAEEGSDDAAKALAAIRTASNELAIESTPPMDWIHSIAYGVTQIGALICLTKLGVISSLPTNTDMAYSELASKVGVGQDALERICRYTATFGYLQERTPGRIEHSQTSKDTAEYIEGITQQLGIYWPALLTWPGALVKDPAAEELNTSAFALSKKRADGRCPTVWEYLEENPKEQEVFGKYMQLGAKRSGLGTDRLQERFDWNSLPSGATVVDVGGGRGQMMFGLAKMYPSLQYVVQDLSVYAAEDVYQDATSKVKFMAHDFFKPQPLEADVYFFQRIFHDWPDKYCKKIISATASAMKPGSRLLIQEAVVPEPRGRPDHEEYMARSMDMHMSVLFNAKERSLKQWKSLLSDTEPRLKFDSVSEPDGSALSLLAFRLAES